MFVLSSMALLSVKGQNQNNFGMRHLATEWACDVKAESVWPEYPRPLMQRHDWLNLNGLWQYAVVEKNDTVKKWDGDILVPFCIESYLSQVQRFVDSDMTLCYQRGFKVPNSWSGRRVLLHFGAVNSEAEVWVNRVYMGTHSGGFSAFSFDITDALRDGQNILAVRVNNTESRDAAAYRDSLFSKQSACATGIWQTVWLEPVPSAYIRSVQITPDIDDPSVRVDITLSEPLRDAECFVEVLFEAEPVSEGRSTCGTPIKVAMPRRCLFWTPDHPYLYTLKISVSHNGAILDRVDSYFAMRCYGTTRDANGVLRPTLNRLPVFHFGVLDQGYWPDGRFTAPADAALCYDVAQVKALGFNAIRKYQKVEPARWYYHCDRMGVMVWQDLPCEIVRMDTVEDPRHNRWGEMISQLRSHPSIAAWIPMGAESMIEKDEIDWISQIDSTRLVDVRFHDNGVGSDDFCDRRDGVKPRLSLCDATRVNAIGAFGGVECHEMATRLKYEEKSDEGNTVCQKITDLYVEYAEEIYKLYPEGLSAAFYVRLSDCATRSNGIMTFDRSLLKMDGVRLLGINRKISHALAE